MRFISAGEAIRLCEQETGSQQLEDFNLLDSAVTRPQNYIAYADGEPDIHPVFYLLNGWELAGEDSDVYALVLDVAEAKIDVAEIALRLHPMVREIDLPDE